MIARFSAQASTLEQSQDQLHLLVEQVREHAIFLLDTAGHVHTWNTEAERIKGYDADEIVGQHFSVFYTPEDIARGKPAFELARAEAEGHCEAEGWRVRKDGSHFWASVVITALRGPGGELRGFGKVTRDMTRRRRDEERRAGEGRGSTFTVTLPLVSAPSPVAATPRPVSREEWRRCT
jgi:PAS domain S-box-containing protein